MKFIKKHKNLFIMCCILSILLISSVISVFFLHEKNASHKYAEIYRDDKLLYTIDLEAVDKPYTLRIAGDAGNYNIIEIRHNCVGIIEATCPDKLCVDMGFISDSPIPIVCLPNHIVIKLTGEADDNADVVAQ